MRFVIGPLFINLSRLNTWEDSASMFSFFLESAFRFIDDFPFIFMRSPVAVLISLCCRCCRLSPVMPIDACRVFRYHGQSNLVSMMHLLVPLHEQLEKGPETALEERFLVC